MAIGFKKAAIATVKWGGIVSAGGVAFMGALGGMMYLAARDMRADLQDALPEFRARIASNDPVIVPKPYPEQIAQRDGKNGYVWAVFAKQAAALAGETSCVGVTTRIVAADAIPGNNLIAAVSWRVIANDLDLGETWCKRTDGKLHRINYRVDGKTYEG